MKHKQILSWLLVAVILVLTVGDTWLAVLRADTEIRTDLLVQARIMAQAIDIDHVKSLAGTGEDQNSPDYQRLQEQLAAIRSAKSQCRLLYLMSRKADRVLFLVDSEPSGSKGDSQPRRANDESSADILRVLNGGSAVVEGPITDRWGARLSALVPINDPASRAVVAVLGMDIDARVWKWDVVSRAALPLRLMLVLLIIGVVAIASVRAVQRDSTDRSTEVSPKPIMRRLVPPLAAMLILLILCAAPFLWQQQQQRTTDDFMTYVSDVFKDLRTALGRQTDGLAASARTIAADTGVQKALREMDPDRLLAVSRPLFETMQRDSRFAHFGFLDTNRVCLLRVHMPEKRGDRIDSCTAVEATRTGKVASGIELGPLGTFSLRVVQPVLEGTALVGYVELGREIEDVLQSLHLRPDSQMAVVVRKKYLDRETWEAGMRVLGRNADWDRMPRSVMMYATGDHLPDTFISWADHFADEVVGSEAYRKTTAVETEWRASAMPLPDASGTRVGDLLIISSTSGVKAAFARLLALKGSSGLLLLVLLLVLLLGFVHILLYRVDQSIQARLALRESATQFRATLESTADGILAVDNTGKVIHANRRFLELWRIPQAVFEHGDAQTMQDTVLEQLVDPDQFRSKMRELFSSDAVDMDTLALKDGRVFERYSLPMIMDDIRIGRVWSFRDITERTRADEERQKMQRLQSVGTMAGGIAHDFNNILMGLFGNISMAKQQFPRSHPGYTLLEEAETSMDRAVRLTKQLLTFARGGDPVKEHVSMGVLIGEVARFDLSGSKVRLVYQPSDNLWLAKVDKGQIQQVVSNLTINAREAMPEGGNLYIAMENAVLPEAVVPGLSQGKYIKITVRDEGVGIDPKRLDRIFDPYFTTKQSGSGLGLATVYSIVHRHSGHIGVVSELGKGTTFTLYLPASDSSQPAETKQAAAQSPASVRPARILVMDDEEPIRKIVTRMLQSCGFTVETAPGGQETIALYKQALDAGASFDAVIMDLTIPGGIGGKEAIKGLLAIDPRIKAIVSSGYADDPVMANYTAYGFKDVAAKPYSLNGLREVLERVLKG